MHLLKFMHLFNYKNRKWLIIFIISFCYGCEKKIDLDIPLRDTKLVVEGLITNEKGPYYVRLTRTSKYSFAYDSARADWEKGARVVILDDAGSRDTLDEVAPGIYRTEPAGIQGIVGRTYTVDILTQEGKHFVSAPEQMIAIPRIDSIYFDRDETDRVTNSSPDYRYNVYLDWKDPGGSSNYYLHDISFYWNNMWHDEVRFNWTFNDKLIDGLPVKKWTAVSSYGRYNFVVRVDQYSLTKKAYLFWSLVHEQTQNSEDGISNSSVPLIGNVYNAADPGEYVLGYFQVSAKTTASVFIDR